MTDSQNPNPNPAPQVSVALSAMPSAALDPKGIMRSTSTLTFDASHFSQSIVDRLIRETRTLIREAGDRKVVLTTQLTDRMARFHNEELAAFFDSVLASDASGPASILHRTSSTLETWGLTPEKMPVRCTLTYNGGNSCMDWNEGRTSNFLEKWNGDTNATMNYFLDSTDLPKRTTVNISQTVDYTLPASFTAARADCINIRRQIAELDSYIGRLRTDISNPTVLKDRAQARLARAVASNTEEGRALIERIDNITSEELLEAFDVDRRIPV
jgi:hypothetical protein